MTKRLAPFGIAAIFGMACGQIDEQKSITNDAHVVDSAGNVVFYQEGTNVVARNCVAMFSVLRSCIAQPEERVMPLTAFQEEMAKPLGIEDTTLSSAGLAALDGRIALLVDAPEDSARKERAHLLSQRAKLVSALDFMRALPQTGTLATDGSESPVARAALAVIGVQSVRPSENPDGVFLQICNAQAVDPVAKYTFNTLKLSRSDLINATCPEALAKMKTYTHLWIGHNKPTAFDSRVLQVGENLSSLTLSYGAGVGALDLVPIAKLKKLSAQNFTFQSNEAARHQATLDRFGFLRRAGGFGAIDTFRTYSNWRSPETGRYALSLSMRFLEKFNRAGAKPLNYLTIQDLGDVDFTGIDGLGRAEYLSMSFLSTQDMRPLGRLQLGTWSLGGSVIAPKDPVKCPTNSANSLVNTVCFGVLNP